MRTPRRDISIEAGTTYRRTLRFYTDRERTTPIDLTGYTLASWITSGSFRIEFDVEVTDAENGVAVMELQPEQTIDVLTGKYTWDILCRDNIGDVKKYVKGEATIYPTGTRLPTNE